MREINEFVDIRLAEFNVEKLEKLRKVKFVLLSKHNYITWLHIMRFFLKKENLNVGELYEKLDSYISRQSYFEVLNNYEKLDIIQKINYQADSRQKLILPTLSAFLEFCEWANFKHDHNEYQNVLDQIKLNTNFNN